jgi:hypothetical protein
MLPETIFFLIVEYLDVGVNDLGQMQPFNVGDDTFKQGVYHTALVAHHGEAQGATLPFVLVVNLGDGQVKLAPDPAEDSFDYPTLGLQGTGFMDDQSDNADSYDHSLRLRVR